MKEKNLVLLGELPMISSICNLSVEGYEANKDKINNIFSTITKNILNKVKI